MKVVKYCGRSRKAVEVFQVLGSALRMAADTDTGCSTRRCTANINSYGHWLTDAFRSELTTETGIGATTDWRTSGKSLTART